ncbi:hypothetical protein BT69DRAFT_1228547 [Atractiella rhizophila]|nr:hypothetical protein BT69DRAFT_1228547 [Atractiella rhizophila]
MHILDPGYTISPICIRPFSADDLGHSPHERARRKRFNYLLSSKRIGVEHAFGRLKVRFPGLMLMAGRHIDEIYEVILPLMAIHNICIDFGDKADDLPDYQELNQRARADHIATRADELEAIRSRRVDMVEGEEAELQQAWQNIELPAEVSNSAAGKQKRTALMDWMLEQDELAERNARH